MGYPVFKQGEISDERKNPSHFNLYLLLTESMEYDFNSYFLVSEFKITYEMFSFLSYWGLSYVFNWHENYILRIVQIFPLPCDKLVLLLSEENEYAL